jgi:FkbM family methyltransferase|tara:strand:- start:413 stop:1159 length:747 start_codon:yes stop_codon:yes gene_type:complete
VLKKHVSWDNGNFFLLTENLYEYNFAKYFLEKEKCTTEWIKEYFRKGDVVFDIGANVGHISLYISKQFDDDISIYAFEPGFANFNKLKQNILANSCPNIKTFNMAFSNSIEIGGFCYKNVAPGRSQHSLFSKMHNDGMNIEVVLKDMILILTVDVFIDMFNVPCPSHVKIDVDGAEDNVIKGMEKTLKNKSLQSINIEITGSVNKHEYIINILCEYGFLVYMKKLHKGRTQNSQEFLTCDYYLHAITD